MFTVYVIFNPERQKIYIGQTQNLEQRLKRHNGELKNKITSFTSKNSGNWRLIYQECYNTRQEAMNREGELKSYQGRQFIKNLQFSWYIRKLTDS